MKTSYLLYIKKNIQKKKKTIPKPKIYLLLLFLTASPNTLRLSVELAHTDKSNIPLLVTLHIAHAKTRTGRLRMPAAALVVGLLERWRQEAADPER